VKYSKGGKYVMSSERVLFIKRLGLLGLTNVINTLIGIVLIPIFTKGRSLEDYGLWVQIKVSLALIPGLTCLGLPYTMVRYIAGEKDKSKIKGTIYSILFVIFGVNAVLSPLFTYLVIRYFRGNKLRVVPIFAIILFIQALNMVGWNYLRAMQRMNLLIIIGVAYAIINDMVFMVLFLLFWTCPHKINI